MENYHCSILIPINVGLKVKIQGDKCCEKHVMLFIFENYNVSLWNFDIFLVVILWLITQCLQKFLLLKGILLVEVQNKAVIDAFRYY